jgi:hypothetical protein
LWYIAPLALAVLLAAAAAGAGSTAAGARARPDDRTFDPSLGRQVRITPSVTIVEPSAFDWADAGVGAAGAFGLVLLASGVVLIFATQRGRAA